MTSFCHLSMNEMCTDLRCLSHIQLHICQSPDNPGIIGSKRDKWDAIDNEVIKVEMIDQDPE